MAMKKALLALEVTYDDRATDAEALASALDTLMETALSTPGILDEYGPVDISGFFVAPAERKERRRR